MDIDFSMTNEDLSRSVDIIVDTVQRIRSILIGSGDISEALERKLRGQEDARKVRSKEAPGTH